jgi:tRNA-Thr(GGU) m(6)t(6)A37 methyltransferase TsaA
LEPIVIRPIGFVVHQHSDEVVRSSTRGVDGVIEVLPEYVDGLRGLDGFSHIIVVAYLHRVPEEGRRVLLARPRGLARRLGIPLENLPEVGVFATDSPHRPNPIAVSVVRLYRVVGRYLYVGNLDLYNGTPVLDIKPYTPSRRVDTLSLPNWYAQLLEVARERGLGEV